MSCTAQTKQSTAGSCISPMALTEAATEISELGALQQVLGIGAASGVQPKRGPCAPKGTGGSRSRCEVILYPCASEPLLLLQAQHSWKAITPAAPWAGVLLP